MPATAGPSLELTIMETFERPLHPRWSDLDPNQHLRHSVYYDFAAQVRSELFLAHGLRPSYIAAYGVGPVLFEEKATFRRELRYGDELRMNAAVYTLRRDYSRFGFRHEIWRGDTLCATVQVYGAWIDLKARKLTAPPAALQEQFGTLPLSGDFAWEA